MNLKKSLGRDRRNLDSDLNITPVMNIFVILIPFLLLTATFVRIAIIELGLPSLQESESQDPEDLKDLTVLVVSIQPDGFKIKTSEMNMPVIPKKSNQFDFETLTNRLQGIKKRFPKLKDVVILPESQIRYQVIVKVLDSCREIGFPNYSISG